MLHLLPIYIWILSVSLCVASKLRLLCNCGVAGRGRGCSPDFCCALCSRPWNGEATRLAIHGTDAWSARFSGLSPTQRLNFVLECQCYCCEHPMKLQLKKISVCWLVVHNNNIRIPAQNSTSGHLVCGSAQADCQRHWIFILKMQPRGGPRWGGSGYHSPSSWYLCVSFAVSAH